MFEFILLIIGGLVGAAIDRLWMLWERRPQVEIRGGIYDDAEGGGISLLIRNVGQTAIPAYRIAIFSPAQGTFAPLDRQEAGALEPGDEVEHELPVEGYHLLLAWVEKGMVPSDRVPYLGLELRLIRANGLQSRPLYTSRRLAAGVVRTAYDLAGREMPVSVSETLPQADWADMQDITVRSRIREWLQNRRAN